MKLYDIIMAADADTSITVRLIDKQENMSYYLFINKKQHSKPKARK